MNWGYKPALSARAPILPSLLLNFFDSSWSDQTNSSRRTSTQVTLLGYHPSIRGWSLTISNLRRREFRRTLPPALIFNLLSLFRFLVLRLVIGIKDGP
uniref:Uncharacterized protein n=1 Tax=Rhizoctonia solani TaxID=456999 RepID=N0A6Y6_9AGAM|nr:hypothetical protein RSOL_m00730 [Rhizoctonia solani]AGK45401.1 hypothetical protein RSOL_m00730 [Rhizoctonia solani]